MGLTLFRCDTVYQLLGALSIKYYILHDETADLMLTAATDFSRFLAPLKKEGLFRSIFLSPDSNFGNRTYQDLDDEEQRGLVHNTEKYIYNTGCADAYADYYIGLTKQIYMKLFYYDMVRRGHKPRIHFYEDGLVSYVYNVFEDCKTDILDHESYPPEDRFENNVAEVLLYSPDLYAGGETGIPINALPKLDPEDREFCRILFRIFGSNPLPREKYIFLEEAFLKNRQLSTDVRLLDGIAEVVGKENIIVKLHPRNVVDRFTPRGYKVLEASTIPWELTLLESNMEDKVLLTISSTASVSAKIILKKECNSIWLYELMETCKAVHIRSANFKRFFQKMLIEVNRGRKNVFVPSTQEELKALCTYFERRGIRV